MTVTNPGPALPAAVSGAALYGQGISFPPRVGPDGAIVWSAGELNVRECICTILRTRPGERVELPGFGCGLDRYLYEPNNVSTLRLITADVQSALTRWEPRVRLDGVTAAVNPSDVRAVDVTISYTLVATGLRESLQMTLRAQEAL
jgi:Bacteriophage baseplate protein W